MARVVHPRSTRPRGKSACAHAARDGTRRAKPRRMTKLIAAVFAASLLTTAACSGKARTCDAAVDNAEKLSGYHLTDDIRKRALDKCEKDPPAERDCVIAATSLDDLMKCGTKE